MEGFNAIDSSYVHVEYVHENGNNFILVWVRKYQQAMGNFKASKQALPFRKNQITDYCKHKIKLRLNKIDQ